MLSCDREEERENNLLESVSLKLQDPGDEGRKGDMLCVLGL